MEYDDVLAASFQPSPDGVVSPPTVDASPARRLRDALEPLAMHAVWCRATNEALAALGLDFLSGYVWGRAAALGEPEPGVVVSSFAVFEPGLVVATYEAGRRACSRDDLLAARDAATIASLGAVLEGADVAHVAEALRAAVAGADPTGRPLFAGLSGRPWPEDPVGRLWHACELAREHRGDGHVAAFTVRGLPPVEANILTELWVGLPLGAYTATRGWPPEAIDAAAASLRARGLLDGDRLSPTGVALRSALEADTDALARPVVAALGPDLDAVVDQLTEWSARCIDAGAFPPDVHKRAAG